MKKLLKRYSRNTVRTILKKSAGLEGKKGVVATSVISKIEGRLPDSVKLSEEEASRLALKRRNAANYVLRKIGINKARKIKHAKEIEFIDSPAKILHSAEQAAQPKRAIKYPVGQFRGKIRKRVPIPRSRRPYSVSVRQPGMPWYEIVSPGFDTHFKQGRQTRSIFR